MWPGADRAGRRGRRRRGHSRVLHGDRRRTPVADGKPLAKFDGRTYVQGAGHQGRRALVHAHTVDRAGNLAYRMAARNFNPVAATCGRLCVAETEQLVDGHLNPDTVVTPGIYVHRLTVTRPRVKDIEKLTVRPRSAAGSEA